MEEGKGEGDRKGKERGETGHRVRSGARARIQLQSDRTIGMSTCESGLKEATGIDCSRASVRRLELAPQRERKEGEGGRILTWNIGDHREEKRKRIEGVDVDLMGRCEGARSPRSASILLDLLEHERQLTQVTSEAFGEFRRSERASNLA